MFTIARLQHCFCKGSRNTERSVTKSYFSAIWVVKYICRLSQQRNPNLNKSDHPVGQLATSGAVHLRSTEASCAKCCHSWERWWWEWQALCRECWDQLCREWEIERAAIMCRVPRVRKIENSHNHSLHVPRVREMERAMRAAPKLLFSQLQQEKHCSCEVAQPYMHFVLLNYYMRQWWHGWSLTFGGKTRCGRAAGQKVCSCICVLPDKLHTLCKRCVAVKWSICVKV